MPKKQPKKTAPQFDAAPLEDDDEPMPFVVDDNGDMVLRRSKKPTTKGAKRGKGKKPPR